MTKEQKIQSLKAIKEGRLLPSDLAPAKIYLFREISGSEPKMYKSEFGNVDFETMESIIQDIESKNERRLNCGLPTDTIISLNYSDFDGKANLTLNIE